MPLDGYLLDGSPNKLETITALLERPDPAEFAQPFFRALDMLGTRVPDETLMALRVALSGRRPDDEAIRTVRALIGQARSGDAEARHAYLSFVETPG